MSARQALGRGLGALIPEKGPADVNGKRALFHCGIEEIVPNAMQPRKSFPEEKIRELAESVREKGILQPLVVRRNGDKYELIAGERRWRAAQRAGIKEVPILVKDVSEGEMLELSLIENIQREDLNPIEEAEAYKRLSDHFHLTQEEISQKVGKDRTTVANALRLLKLSPEVRQCLAEGTVTAGHARAFLGVDGPETQRDLLKRLLRDGLSVRQTEALARRLREGKSAAARKPDEDLKIVAEDLQRALQTKIRIVGRRRKGKIEIEYHSAEELDRLIDLLKKP
ncbi:MAG TPA: ParB/RepB/Spo0J family partition protein [Thermodesulfobacteriota bacterium]|nr:ParB/RepB/Spo0J family partition protein [Thermodesulfobacteriota bacterium]